MAIIQHEVQPLSVFEGVFQPHDERVLHSFENTAFADSMGYLVELTDVLLLENFHCVVFLGFFMKYKKHLSVSAFPENF